METIEPIIRQFLEHPHRKRFVLIMTCVAALLGVWPVADRYLALRDYETSLILQLEEAHVMADGVEALEEIAAKRTDELNEWEGRIVSEAETYGFRNSLVSLARSSGCRVRRIDVGSSNQAKWAVDEFKRGNENAKAPTYELRKQSVTVTVAGQLPQILAFLKVLDSENQINHHQTFELKLASRGQTEIVLDIELVLMEPVAKKAA